MNALKALGTWSAETPEILSDIRYKTSSRTYISSDNIQKFKRNFNRYLRILGSGIIPYEKNHYLLYQHLEEKAIVRNRSNLDFQRQAYVGAGVQNSTDLYPGGDEPDWSIYDPFWKFGSVNYVNPLAGEYEKRYFYKVADTIKLKESTLLVILFSPGLRKIAGRLRGIIYYDIENNSIKGLWAESAVETTSRNRISIEFQKIEGRQFTSEISYRQYLTEIQSYNTRIQLHYQKTYSDFIRDKELRDLRFDEFIREFDQQEQSDQNLIPITNDSLAMNTVEFYKRMPSTRTLYNYFYLGREINKGRIPLGGIVLESNKILNYNAHEGLRLGLGFHTSESLIKSLKIEGYSGYGFKDERVKYGAGLTYCLDKRYQYSLKILGMNDVFESGNSDIKLQHEPIFGSENLRKYRISVMDNVIEGGIELDSRISKNLISSFQYKYSEISPTYEYDFQNSGTGIFRYNQIQLGLLLTPKQTKTRIRRNIYVNKSPLPDFYFQWTHNMDGNVNTSSFNKYEFRLNYQRNILGFGKSSLQMNYGLIDRSIPYHRSFVARGGLRNFSVVFHNTFETMRYNEFLSDRHFSLFYSHNFGPLYLPFLNHFPSIEMLHNFGIGFLKNPDDHTGIDFSIMNRGYLESGVFANDILLLTASGLKTGLGAGFFYRYGAYQNPLFRDNIVFKFSLNLDL